MVQCLTLNNLSSAQQALWRVMAIVSSGDLQGTVQSVVPQEIRMRTRWLARSAGPGDARQSRRQVKRWQQDLEGRLD